MTQAPPESGRSGGALLADATRLGGVHLKVTDLDRSLPFYTDVVGLTLAQREGDTAALGAGAEAIVTLHADPRARRPQREAGLYHVALLFGSREELAQAGRRVAETRTRIDGASDHGTHEAIYLPDPDGIGIELAADRPRERWPSQDGGEIFSHGPAPLDVRALFETIADAAPRERADAWLRVGHVHLHVGDLAASTRFYRDGLGFEVMAAMPAATFVSFGRYHHHIAYNLWRGERVPPASPDTVGLMHWTLESASAAERDAVRERLESLGVALEPADGGLLARDPASIAVLVR